MSAHAKLSASGSSRWLACPGSVNAEKGISDRSSPAAHEGTCAHELAEIVLVNGGTCFDWVGKTLIENNEWTVDQEMAEHVQEYVDYVLSFKGEHAYEQRVDFSDWVPEGFGTSDAIIIDGDTLHAIDLKFGKGLQIFAEENPQAMLYGLGAYSDYGMIYDIKRVVVHIVQPRLDHIDTWEISLPDLLKWGEWASQRAEMCLEPDAERVPGNAQCLWCKAKATCPALQQHTQKVIMSDFYEIDSPTPAHLTDDQLKAALDSKKLIVSWLDAVEQHIKERVEKGGFPGYKLVAGRSLRNWGDSEKAAKALKDLLGEESYKKTLISPAQAEKALGKKDAVKIKDLIVKPEGKPTLAPETDKRPSITITSDDFD